MSDSELIRSLLHVFITTYNGSPSVESSPDFAVKQAITHFTHLLNEVRLEELHMLLQAESQEMDADYRPVGGPYSVINDGTELIIKARIKDLEQLQSAPKEIGE